MFLFLLGKRLVAQFDNCCSTLRHIDCLWLSSTQQCMNCYKYKRNVLNSAALKLSNHVEISPGRSSADSHTNYRYCNTPEKEARMTDLHNKVCQQTKEMKQLKDKIDQHISYVGVRTDDQLGNDLKDIMTKHSDSVLAHLEDDSFQAIFWKQQLEAVKCPKKQGVRWHPLIVKWCLYLHHLSNGAYETLRNSGVIQLPSTRTLRDYKHFSPARVGFSVHSDRQLLNLMTVKGNLAKYCVILIDEMYVKEGLTFDKATGALIGLTDFGEVTNKIMELEQHLKCGLSRPVAKTVLTFMVKGLFTDISFPYAYFPVTDVKGQDIFPLL